MQISRRMSSFRPWGLPKWTFKISTICLCSESWRSPLRISDTGQIRDQKSVHLRLLKPMKPKVQSLDPWATSPRSRSMRAKPRSSKNSGSKTLFSEAWCPQILTLLSCQCERPCSRHRFLPSSLTSGSSLSCQDICLIQLSQPQFRHRRHSIDNSGEATCEAISASWTPSRRPVAIKSWHSQLNKSLTI